MINEKEDFAAWIGLIDSLDEAKEHLAKLTTKLRTEGEMDESEFAVYLGHVYAHLNRVWNMRNRATELSDDEWEAFSQFPSDIKPVG